MIRERLASGDLDLGATDTETLATYADEWQKGLSGLKASTVRFYGDNLKRHILPALGHRPVSALNRADCRTFVATLRAKGLRLNTVRGISHT